MDETFDDLVEHLLQGLQPGETLLDGAFHVLWLLLRDAQAVYALLEQFGITVEVCVLDTNRLLNELQYFLRKQRQPSLLLGAKLGGVKLFAAVSVRDEMLRKIRALTSRWPVDLDAVLQAWETQFAPWIHFVDPAQIALRTKQVKTLRDRDVTDVPTGQLIELVDPAAVLSSDRDLEAFGTIAMDTAILTCAYYDKGKREVIVIHLNVAAFLMLQVLVSVLSPLISWLRGVDKRILLSALLLLTAGFGAALLYAPSRKWLLEHYQTIGSRIGPALLDLCDGLQLAAADYEHIRQEAREATHTIEQFRRKSEQPRTARDYAGKVLAAAPEPLHITELFQRMQEDGYAPKGTHPEHYVHRVLRAYPGIFGLDEYQRWYIKRLKSM